ncbi:BA14K family protein [Mesorhizobium sp. M0601]|uniref:BA14K family protein n=1 Tax=unclassified Mesorhizobium TaxID=325217 RepID=UPI00333BEA7C
MIKRRLDRLPQQGDRHVQAHHHFRPRRHHCRRRHAGRHRSAVGRPSQAQAPRHRHCRRCGGFLLGSALAQPRTVYIEEDGGSWHVRRCLNRYQSYDPYSDTYVGYDGYRHRCWL